ncbi:MAG: PfkB family carbohydrate kinase [Clostridia bacterium]|nr:PfkB family carbohydrate kinase [Clostridia bacterium]
MIKIVGIGANVHDTLINLTEYPSEDTKMRALSQKSCGGGPCATGLVAASKLGASAAYIGDVAAGGSGDFLISDFEKFGVSTALMGKKEGYTQFTSYVMLSAKTTSRTIVFDKGDMPGTEMTEERLRAVREAEILMVDGNDLDAAVIAAKEARAAGTKVLYDAGGRYEGIERLLPLADILVPSEEFALGITGKETAEEAAKALYEMYTPEIVIITRGIRGGVGYNGKEEFSYSAFPVEAVDSNGAGDVFHGALAFALTMNYNYYDACVFSSAVSALKCTKVGARDGVPSYDETLKFLKERL